MNRNIKYKQIGGNPFVVIRNNGTDGALTNQCMWISIRDFLRLNGYPRITTQEIRVIGGIGSKYQNEPFDTDNLEHTRAMQRVVNHYRLDIDVYKVNHNGTLANIRDDGVRPAYFFQADIFDRHLQNVPGFSGRYRDDARIKKVNIANYGLYHFELIVSGYTLTPLVIPPGSGLTIENFVGAIHPKGDKTKEMKFINKFKTSDTDVFGEIVDFYFNKLEEYQLFIVQKKSVSDEWDKLYSVISAKISRGTDEQKKEFKELITYFIGSFERNIEKKKKLETEIKTIKECIDSAE